MVCVVAVVVAVCVCMCVCMCVCVCDVQWDLLLLRADLLRVQVSDAELMLALQLGQPCSLGLF